jgi:hypothetical protein
MYSVPERYEGDVFHQTMFIDTRGIHAENLLNFQMAHLIHKIMLHKVIAVILCAA